VTFYSGGCTIAGTFTEAADPVAAALLITGGGRSDRNSDARLPGGRMLRIGVDKAIAGALAGARVCALRYDKRGVGASGGEYLRAGMDDRRADARAALAGWPQGQAASRCSPSGSARGHGTPPNWPPTTRSPAPSCSEAAHGQPRRSCPGRAR
jgi:hypothetical protein